MSDIEDKRVSQSVRRNIALKKQAAKRHDRIKMKKFILNEMIMLSLVEIDLKKAKKNLF